MSIPPWLRDRRVMIPAALILANTLLRAAFSLQGIEPDGNDYAYAALRLTRGLVTRDCPWWTTPGDHFVRWGIVLPLAASFSVFGVNLFALAVPGLLATGGIQGLLYRLVERRAGARAALLSGVLLLFLPSIDFGEVLAYGHWMAAVFVIAAVDAFDRALERPASRGYLWSGVFCGLAYVTWSMSVLVMAGLAAVWLLRKRDDLRRALLLPAAALGVALLDVVVLGILYGDPLYRVHATLHQQSEHAGRWHVTFVSNWTLPFWPGTMVGKALGLVPHLGLLSGVVLIAARREAGLLFSLAWLVPFAVMRLIPRTLSPLEFLALQEPHLLTFIMPLAAASAGVGLAQLWQRHRAAALAATVLAAGFGLLQMALNAEEYRTGTLRPARFAYDLTRERRERLFDCDYRTQHLFRFWDRYREGRSYANIQDAGAPEGEPLILVANRRYLQVLSLPIPAALERRQRRWELLGHAEFEGRIRPSQLLKARVLRMDPTKVDVYRVPP
jgi:hypothetical protein